MENACMYRESLAYIRGPVTSPRAIGSLLTYPGRKSLTSVESHRKVPHQYLFNELHRIFFVIEQATLRLPDQAVH
jgi:hypothetical protein